MVFCDDLGGGRVGVYRSIDQGATWTKVSNTLMDALIDNGTTNQTATSNLEIAVGAANNVYAAIINEGRVEALFRSGDGGTNWTQMETPTTNEGGTDVGLNPGGGKGPVAGSTPEEVAGGQGAIHFSILADPNYPDIVYVGGDRQPLEFQNPTSIGAIDYSGRLFRGDASQPIGSQWVHLTHSNALGADGGGTAGSSAPHADSREMVFDANGDIIEVDDGGIYRRTNPLSDQGDWFSAIGDLQATEVHDIAYDSVSEIAITGNQDTGTMQQPTHGATIWESVSTADGGDVVVDDVSLAGSGQSIRYSSLQNLGDFQKRSYDASGTLRADVFPALSVVGGGEPFDAALPSGMISFVGGESTKPVSIEIRGDSDVEPDEQFTITLSNPSGGARIDTASAAGTILNDDIALSVAATDAVHPEGDTGTVAFTFTVTRTGDTSGATIVDYAVSGSGTDPADGADFGGVLPSGTISFAVGESTELVTIDVRGDLNVEPDEQFTITLSNPSAGAWIDAASAVGTILDDDVALSVAATDAVRAEGDTGTAAFTFTVTRTGVTSGATTVDYTVSGSGANPADAADFVGVLPSGTIGFAAGETSKLVSIDVRGDLDAEPDEQFTITLSNASGGARIDTASAAGTIQNDDVAVSVVATDAVQAEGNTGTVAFTESQIEENVVQLRDAGTIDVNEDGQVDASTDGNLILLVLFGLPTSTVDLFRGNTSLTNEEIRANVVDLTIPPSSSSVSGLEADFAAMAISDRMVADKITIEVAPELPVDTRQELVVGQSVDAVASRERARQVVAELQSSDSRVVEVSRQALATQVRRAEADELMAAATVAKQHLSPPRGVVEAAAIGERGSEAALLNPTVTGTQTKLLPEPRRQFQTAEPRDGHATDLLFKQLGRQQRVARFGFLLEGDDDQAAFHSENVFDLEADLIKLFVLSRTHPGNAIHQQKE